MMSIFKLDFSSIFCSLAKVVKVFLQKKVYILTTKKAAEDNKLHILSSQIFIPFEMHWKNYSYNFENNFHPNHVFVSAS